MKLSPTLAAILCCSLLACDKDPISPVDAASGTDTLLADAGDGSTLITDSQPGDLATLDAEPLPDASASCAAEISGIASELYKTIGSCSAVVRLDHQSRSILGWQLFCSKYATVSESQARSTAQADTGYGASGQMLNTASPSDIFLFYQAPGDFGGAAAVSARTGLSIFGGSIIWMGTGQITYPSSWRAKSGLGSNCPTPGTIPPSKGYDLVNASALSKADVDQALAVAIKTALPAAFVKGGYLFDAVVLRYPRTVGAFDPSTAEWLVILNGGYLE